MNPDFKKNILKATNSSSCEEVEIIQSLWSGYGKISRYQLDNSPSKTVVVKHIALNAVKGHPRGWDTDLSHNRKVKSYKVETYWYQHWNQACTQACRTPKHIASFSQGQEQWIILEDLDFNFPLRKTTVTDIEIKVCLLCLANFHAKFLNHQATGLWQVGTYWHLQTRPDEFEKMSHKALKAKAHWIDQTLNECQFQTIVHGDAKLANFCFSKNGAKVAMVDFQYVGGGCGMKDVAYFLGSCLSSNDLETFENEFLNFYFRGLEKALEKVNKDTINSNIKFQELEEEWRRLYPFAVADFTRFLLGWMPTHQKINKYNLDMTNKVLAGL